MKKIRLILILLLCTAGISQISGASFKDETLKYVISYKWGLIHKDAGEATLSLRKAGDVFNIMLTAKTKPWADKIYQVRDTLKGKMRASDLKPLTYHKITHEKGKYKRDEIAYSYSNGTVTGTAKRFRYEKGNESVTEKTLTSKGPTYDMLSVFYYIRQLDYAKLDKNVKYTASIFSGKEKETIAIKCLGKEKIKMRDGKEREAYHIRFNFTRKGGKKSSDDMDTWISTDSSHIPLYLTGKLPVGEVRAYLVS